MKAWKDAKTMQEQSGFSLREEDCERSKSIATSSIAEASSFSSLRLSEMLGVMVDGVCCSPST